MWCSSSAGSRCGKSRRRCAPRLSSRASAHARDEPHERMRRRRAACAGRRRRARALRAATARRGSPAASSRARPAPGAGAARRRPARLGERGERGTAAEDEALAERVRREPVRAVQAGAGALADGVEAGDGRRARRGRSRSRPSCSARRARPARARASGRCPLRRSTATTFGNSAGSTARMSSPTDARRVSRMRRATASATSSRGASSSTKRSPPASSSIAPSPRTASVTRKPSAPSAPATAVGWNCMISRSASAAPAAWASSMPAPTAPGGLVVRDHSAAAPPVASTTARRRHDAPVVAARTPTQRPPIVGSATARQSSSTSIRSCSATSADSWRVTRRPVALPPAWTMRRTRVAALQPEREAAVAVGVEAHAEPLEVAHARRRLARRGPRRRCAGTVPRPARDVSSRWRSRRVVERERGGEPALRPVAGRLRERRWRETSATRAPSRAAVSAAYSPAAPAPTTATSASIVCGRRHRGQVPYSRMAPPVYLLATRRRSRTTRAPTPSARRASRRSSASSRAATGSGWSGVEAPRVAAETLTRGAPGAPRRRRSRRCATRGGGTIDADTVVVAGSYEAALHAAGGAVRLVDLLLAARRRRGFCALRPPGHHAEPARAMGFCLFNNVAVAARHARDAHGLERVLVLDWDVHHGNGTNAIFHAIAGGPVRLDPPVAAVSRDRAGERRRQRRRRGLHGQPAGAGGLGRRALRVARRARRGPARARLRARTSSSSRRASTRTATTRSPDCRADRGRLRGDGAAVRASRRPSSARRSAPCWRAATTWARSPPRRPRRCACYRRRSRRAAGAARRRRRCRGGAARRAAGRRSRRV